VISREESSEVTIYPKTNENPSIAFADFQTIESPIREMSSFRIGFKKVTPEINVTKHSAQKFAVTIDRIYPELNDIILEIDYVGDTGMAFVNGEMITDHFYHGSPWEIGLKSFAYQLKDAEIVFVFQPIYADYEFLGDLKTIPEFTNDSFLEVRGFQVIPEYRAIMLP